MLLQLAERQLACIGEAVSEAALVFQCAQGYSSIGRKEYERGLIYFQKGEQIGLTMLAQGITNISLAMLYNNWGALYQNMAQFDAAINCYHKSIDFLQSQNCYNEFAIANEYSNMASVYRSMGRVEESIASFLHAKGLWEQCYAEEQLKRTIKALEALGYKSWGAILFNTK